METEIKILSAGDLAKECEEYERKIFGEGVDGIRIDNSRKEITLGRGYYISADQGKTKDDLLRLIAHIAPKGWVTGIQIHWVIRIMCRWHKINLWDYRED